MINDTGVCATAVAAAGCFEFWRSTAEFPRQTEGKSKCDIDKVMGDGGGEPGEGGRPDKDETSGEIFIVLVVSLSRLAWGSGPGPKQEHCSRFAVVGRMSLLSV
jgi:hypothetical protein